MNEVLCNYKRFFEDQIQESEQEFVSYLKSPLSSLFQEDRVFWGKVVSINENLGHITIQVPKGHCPRLKISMSLAYFDRMHGMNWEVIFHNGLVNANNFLKIHPTILCFLI